MSYYRKIDHTTKEQQQQASAVPGYSIFCVYENKKTLRLITINELHAKRRTTTHIHTILIKNNGMC